MSDKAAVEMVTLTIDNNEVSVPKGTLIIRAAETIGIRIPRFCDHPLLKPAGACRQCLVEVAMPDREGNVRPMPKPQTACTMTVMPGMEVKTQRTSEVAEKAQKGIMEFLLINHPLDCPICDKGGECPLQNQAMTEGREVSRFADAKRTFPKPVRLSTQILLDRERCILCQRCVRFSKQIAGDAFIDLQGRGGGSSPVDDHYFMGEQIGTFDTAVLGFHNEDLPHGAQLPAAEGVAGPYGGHGIAGSLHAGPTGDAHLDETGRPFASYFSGNTIQICPVGALTAASYRFRGRPFDLASTPSVTEHDASGSAIRVDIRRGNIVRRLAGEDAAVNEEWITDKDRFAYQWAYTDQRLNTPLVREGGKLVESTWAEALTVAAAGLAKAKDSGKIAAMPGGRLSVEDAYAWSKFARLALGTNQVDQRVRATSFEETKFLGAFVAGRGLDVTYEDIEKAGRVLLVGLEPEDEIGSVFLRLRKGVLAGTVKVTTVAPYTTASSHKLQADVIHAAPGTEPEVIDHLGADLETELANGIVLVGERCVDTPGLYSAVARLISATGARVAWIPRRAGERGGVEAGLLPQLLPFGRPWDDPAARAEVESVWGAALPETGAKCTVDMLADTESETLAAAVVGGVDLRDVPDPAQLRRALETAGFVVSLEVNASELTEYADVVLPVAPPSEKNGTFINWEGRLRPFGQALASRALTDRDALVRLAAELGVNLGIETLAQTHAEMNELMGWAGTRLPQPEQAARELHAPARGEAVLATHKLMLDDGLLQAGAPELAGTARKSVARLNAETIRELGMEEGQRLQVSTERGTITLPVVAADLPAGVVWLPTCSRGSHVHETLGAGHGNVVTVSAYSEVTR
ncbi:MAG: NADH-quinone oxidoreductase subunit G [Actinomycetaceae bacterium]|nr:NADH-quinone oxidoreductase subunit G [Actinomycetaceae bacterium]